MSGEIVGGGATKVATKVRATIRLGPQTDQRFLDGRHGRLVWRSYDLLSRMGVLDLWRQRRRL